MDSGVTAMAYPKDIYDTWNESRSEVRAFEHEDVERFVPVPIGGLWRRMNAMACAGSWCL